MIGGTVVLAILEGTSRSSAWPLLCEQTTIYVRATAVGSTNPPIATARTAVDFTIRDYFK